MGVSLELRPWEEHTYRIDIVDPLWGQRQRDIAGYGRRGRFVSQQARVVMLESNGRQITDRRTAG